MKYVLLIAADEEAWLAMTDGDRDDAVSRIGSWYQELAQSGRIVAGYRLGGRSAATTVKLGPAGRSAKPVTTDGPLVEAKEIVGSLAVVEVDSLGDAVAIARSWPAGGSVEVRPVIE